MALTTPIKTALDNMNDIDKALVMLYVFGVDDTQLAVTIGDAFISRFYSWNEAPTNDERALAILLQTRQFTKDTYVDYQSHEAAKTAREAARVTAVAAVPFGDIGDIVEPEA